MIRELVEKNRSYRGYDESVRVTDEQLEELLAVARMTPSSMNLQPLCFLTANTPEENEKIFPHTIWAGRLKGRKLPYEGHRPTAYIVVMLNTELTGKNNSGFLKDVGIVSQTILLRATEMGLGGIMIGSFNRAAVLKEFDLPDCMQPELIIALGKPDETVVLETAENGEVGYYRDEADVHHVPKRPLEELWLNRGQH